MFRLSSLLVGLPVIIPLVVPQSVAAAARFGPRQASPASPVQVAKLASLENVAVRSNGQILATNMNSPNLYAVDPVAKTTSTAVAITGAAGLSGIGEVAPDVFVVIGGKPEGTAVHKVDFTGGTPKATLIKTLPDAKNMNGLAVFNNDTVLLGDAAKGTIFKLTVSTGDYSVAITDPTMAPSGGIPFGIDGLKYKDGVVWYTNIFKNSFHKVSVDATAKATGPVTTLWTNLMGDDLCFGNNGKIYLTTNSGANEVVEVDPAVGKPNVVAKLSAPTACAAGRTDKDKDVIYVTNGQGVYALTIKL